ncbi:fibrinogen-like YCDxxxxGGGW domain-containing protein [Marinilabilia salmonicolor]|uniref:fibrinogen-like YCDxxxxGGGW domain-containing protein n=1 Tax=Marinilabilia salmonicolor TaxID=989 RepID=UPI00046A667C|nr:fibrinogen-like YCDxxxxGGGW domain-containing protein [Marinilabilia salmonicolor]
MKKLLLFYLFFQLSPLAFGQTTGKIGGTEKNAIIKIGGVPVESIGRIGDISTPVLYKSCKEIKVANPEAVDGIYTIDPDGEGGSDPFECYCDMTTDGGGGRWWDTTGILLRKMHLMIWMTGIMHIL